jgi:hypothetical protein
MRSDIEMILTVIRGREVDLQLAGIAATALCSAELTQSFPGGLPSRVAVADASSLEVMCDTVNAPRVRSGFVRAGFDTIEKVADPQIPAKTKIVTLTVGPEEQKFLQMADPAADALCGAGLTVAYADGKSYSGDLFSDATVKVQCDQADAAVVQKAFAAVWTSLGSS